MSTGCLVMLVCIIGILLTVLSAVVWPSLLTSR
jgi:hypothetical protein